MKNSSTAAAMIALLGAMACALPHAADAGASSPVFIRNLEPFEDPSGAIATYNANGRIDTRGAFFQSLGTNGRSCASCHAVDQAMSIAPPQLRGRFKATHGRDPVFAAVDGANCPNAAVGDPAGHSLLLNYGLIRIPQPIPATAQFTLSVVHDPYGCALVVDPATGLLTASVYRRPLPTTNLRFLSAIMFDGRETVQPLTSVLTFDANLNADLTHQAQTAVTVHFQANHTPTPAQLADIVNFELGLSTAQIWDRTAGPLDRAGADGGPVNLADQVYYPGLNDVLGADPTGAPFDMNGMSMFSAWLATASVGAADFRNAPPAFDDRPASEPLEHAAARSDIAAGETLFNTLPITISGVRGLNDNAALGKPSSFIGHCTTCHDTPNVGDHSLPLPLELLTTNPPSAGTKEASSPPVGPGNSRKRCASTDSREANRCASVAQYHARR